MRSTTCENPAPLEDGNRAIKSDFVGAKINGKGTTILLSEQASPRRLTVTAKPDGLPKMTVRGQTARSLLELVEAGPNGRTALEVSTWALRFAAYCHDLKHKHGLTIRTDREEHDGGWHGRHVLETPVEIIEVSDGGGAT